MKVNTLILSNDGNYSLNGGEDGRVELRDAWTLDLLHTFPKEPLINAGKEPQPSLVTFLSDCIFNVEKSVIHP